MTDGDSGGENTAENTRDSSGSGVGRTLRRLVLALVLLELLYLGVANGLLVSSAFQDFLNRRPEKFTVEWERAWTWVPTHVHVRKLELEGGAPRASWSVTLDKGRLDIGLFQLARRRFVLRGAHGDRTRIEVDTRPPPEGPRPPRKKRRGWIIDLRDVNLASLDHLRLDEQLLEGAGALRGGATFQIRGDMLLDIRDLRVAKGRLLSAGEVAADELDLQARMRLGPLPTHGAKLRDVLAASSAAIELEAEASNLGFLSNYLKGTPWLAVSGQGHLTADLETKQGLLQRGSRIELTGPSATASFFGLTALGSGRVTGWVPEDEDALRLEVALDQFTVDRSVTRERILEGEGLRLRAFESTIAIYEPAGDVRVELELPQAKVPEIARLDGLLPVGLDAALLGGSAVLDAKLIFDRKSGTGGGDVHIKGDAVDARFQGAEFLADLELDALLSEIQFEAGQVRVDGSRLQLSNVKIKGQEGIGEPWWGLLNLEEGVLTKKTGTGTSLDGRLHATLRDTSPLTALLKNRVPKLAWLDRALTVEGRFCGQRFDRYGS